MKNFLSALELAKKNLKKIESYKPTGISEPVTTAFSSRNSSNSELKIDKLNLAKRNLKKLATSSGTTGFTTITINSETDNIPERWCPEVTTKVRLQDLPEITSEKIISINGGTP